MQGSDHLRAQSRLPHVGKFLLSLFYILQGFPRGGSAEYFQVPLLECFLGANKIIDPPVHFYDLLHFSFHFTVYRTRAGRLF